jgi:hypothetical protein
MSGNSSSGAPGGPADWPTRVIGAGRSEALSAMTNAMAVLDAELVESDAGLMAATVLATALNPAAIEEGCGRPSLTAQRDLGQNTLL